MDNPQQWTHSSGHYGVHFRETPVAVHRPIVQHALIVVAAHLPFHLLTQYMRLSTRRPIESVYQLFIEASPTVEKAASRYKADQLVATLLSFHSVQSSLAVREFRAAGEEHCKRGHGRVCANL